MNEPSLADVVHEAVEKVSALDAEASALRAKVARVRAWRDREVVGGWIERPVEELDAALSDDPEAFLDALADQPEC